MNPVLRFTRDHVWYPYKTPRGADRPLTYADVKAGAEAQVISEEQLRKAEEYVQQEEGATNRLSGWVGVTVMAIAVAMSLFHLYAAYDIVPTIPTLYDIFGNIATTKVAGLPVAQRNSLGAIQVAGIWKKP